MKIAFCTAIAVAALGLSAGTASAQYVVPYPGYQVLPVYPAYGYRTYSPGLSLSLGYSSPGLSVGGFYAPGGYSTYRPYYGGYGYPYSSYYRGYSGGHYNHGHYHR
jgi:hypothetical protein